MRPGESGFGRIRARSARGEIARHHASITCVCVGARRRSVLSGGEVSVLRRHGRSALWDGLRRCVGSAGGAPSEKSWAEWGGCGSSVRRILARDSTIILQHRRPFYQLTATSRGNAAGLRTPAATWRSRAIDNPGGLRLDQGAWPCPWCQAPNEFRPVAPLWLPRLCSRCALAQLLCAPA